MTQLNHRAARSLFTAIAALVAFMAWSTFDATEAKADTLIGVDLNGGFNVGELSADGAGLGANARLGYSLDIPVLRLVPELQFNYMGFALDDVQGQGAIAAANSGNLRTISGRAGARVGFSAIVGLSLYGHVGYGTAITVVDGQDNRSDAGLSYDVGLAIDFTAIPLINLGIHGGFNSLTPGDDALEPINWIDVGAHVELVF